jgi:SpoVK/Ycf46/Vps4 family AAA+-type ATPase
LKCILILFQHYNHLSLDIVDLWFGLPQSCQNILITILNSLPADQATFLIATSNVNQQVPDEIAQIFDRPWKDKFSILLPSKEQRKKYFQIIKKTCLTVRKIF